MLIKTALLLAIFSAITEPGTLTGRVAGEAGMPIAGARVQLSTARPRVGLPTTCPSCYRDCAKSARTDDDGRFSIAELDPVLLFRVLVMAPGRRAVLTELIDPAATELDVKLIPLPGGLPNDRMLQGRVLDEGGQPLAGAVVWPTGAKTHEKRWWGALPGVDEAAITDAEGRFVVTSQDVKLGLDLKATAPGYATFPAQLFDLDGREHEIRLRRGAHVSGRLVYQGQPVRRRDIGMVQRDRSVPQFVGETTLASDDDGRFLFLNLQPEQPYVLYSLCGAADLPVLKTLTVTTGDDNNTVDLGDVLLTDGLTLAGRVELPTGAAMPDNAKLRLSRDPAWDWCEVSLTDGGTFEIRGLPPEVYSVSIIAPGFELDASRMRYQVTGAHDFGLRLRAASSDSDSRLTYVVVPLKATRK
jgi:hypothetical protein